MEQLNYITRALTTTASSTRTATMATSKQQLVALQPKNTHLSVVGVTCFLCIVIVITVFGNSFALLAFRMSRKLRHVAYYFTINLCISDLCVALLSMPFWISYLLTGWPNKTSGAIYSIWICLDIFFGTWSIMSLAVMSIERYVCIIYPLRYENMVTKKRAWLAVAFVLIYSTSTSCLGYVQISLNKSIVSVGIFVFAYIIPVLIKMFTYRKIYMEARRQRHFVMEEDKHRKRFSQEQETATADLSTVQVSSGNKPQEKDASCCFVKDDQCNGFRVIWRKCTSEVRKQVNNDRHREEPKLNEGIYRTHSSESECEENEMLKRDGIEDWTKYLDGLESNVSIENMDSHSGEIKCPQEMKQSSEQRCFIQKSNEHFEEKSSSNSMQANQVNKKTITNSQYSLTSTSKKMQWSKATRGCFSSIPFPPTSLKLFRSERLAQMKHKSIVRLRHLNRELKAAKIIGTIIGTFLVLWTPFMLVVILASVEVPISVNTVIIVKCLHYANSAINPILYVVLNKTFKRVARSMLIKLGVRKAQRP